MINYILELLIADVAEISANSLWFVTLALNIVFSSLDEKWLQKAGHDTSRMGSSWIVPVYLFKRSRILKQSSAYFVVWIVCIVLVILD